METQDSQVVDAVRARIEAVLEEVRPRLRLDEADVEFATLDAKGHLRLRLTGSCRCCPMAVATLKSCIENRLKQRVPEVCSVKLER